jgi:hypothetical protein
MRATVPGQSSADASGTHELGLLVASWRGSLSARGRSPKTVTIYTSEADAFRRCFAAGCAARRVRDHRIGGTRQSAHRQGSPERRVQLTDQFPDPATATRGDGVAPQDVHHDGRRKDPRLRDVVGSDGGIVSGAEFERSCGMGGRSEDVRNLSGACQGGGRPHRPRGRQRAQRRWLQPVLHRGLPEPPGVPPRHCHGAPWSARLHARTPAQRRSRFVDAGRQGVRVRRSPTRPARTPPHRRRPRGVRTG